MAVDESLIDRIATSLRQARASFGPDAPTAVGEAVRPRVPGVAPDEDRAGGVAFSILAQAAALYGAKPDEEATPPTGFDPAAAALFEALVEGAFLVANADGEFDADERAAFEQVVLAATEEKVSPKQLQELVADLASIVAEDGAARRIELVGRTVARADQQHEVLRVAALIAHVSGGVSDVERRVMDQLSAAFGLGAPAVEQALEAAERVISG